MIDPFYEYLSLLLFSINDDNGDNDNYHKIEMMKVMI